MSDDTKKFFSPEARDARRAARLNSFAPLKGSVGHAKQAGDKLTTQNAGLRAVAMVREILNNYNLPGLPSLKYSGIRGSRTAMNSSRLQDGVVTVSASFKSTSGVGVSFDIPIEIFEGKLLEPSVIVHNGEPRIIAQSSFDDIVERNTFKDYVPVRDLYAAPMDKSVAKDLYGNRTKQTKVNRGIFSIGANRENLRRAMRGQDMVVQAQAQAQNPETAELVQYLYDMMQEKAWDLGHQIEQSGMSMEQAIQFLNDTPYEWAWEVGSKFDSVGAMPHDAAGVKRPKPPKAPSTSMPKPPKPPAVKSKPTKNLCSRCSHAPCVCPNKRKKKALEVVEAELHRLYALRKTAQAVNVDQMEALIKQLEQMVQQHKQQDQQKQILGPDGKPATPAKQDPAKPSAKPPPPPADALSEGKAQPAGADVTFPPSNTNRDPAPRTNKTPAPAAPGAPAPVDPTNKTPAPAAPGEPAPAPAEGAPAEGAPAEGAPAEGGEEGFATPPQSNAQLSSVMKAVESNPYYKGKYGAFFSALNDASSKPVDQQHAFVPKVQKVLEEMANDPKAARLLKQVKGPLDKYVNSLRPKKNLMTKMKDKIMRNPAEPEPWEQSTHSWDPEKGYQKNKPNQFKSSSVYRAVTVRATTDLVAKVNQEVSSMRNDGLSDIDIKQAVFSKYGPHVAAAVFNEE